MQVAVSNESGYETDGSTYGAVTLLYLTLSVAAMLWGNFIHLCWKLIVCRLSDTDPQRYAVKHYFLPHLNFAISLCRKFTAF